MKIKAIVKHILVIVICYLIVDLILIQAGGKFPPFIIITYLIMNVCTFYFLRYLLFFYLEQKSNWHYWLLILPAVFVAYDLLSFLIGGIISIVTVHKGFPSFSIKRFVLPIYPGVLVFGIAGISYYIYWGRKKEVELVRSQYLNKIALYNPHLIFNMANALYKDILKLNAVLGENTLLLVQCLRFSLQQQSDTGLISLQDELDYLERFIAMHQYLNKNALQIRQRIDILIDPSKFLLPPMVIVTLVDNMIKHGDLFDPNNPGLITIACNNKQFDVHLFNKKSVNRTGGTGIGITNVEFRLKQAFGKKGNLSINQNGNNFEINLTIQL